MVVLGARLDSMFLEVFSNLNDYMVLYFLILEAEWDIKNLNRLIQNKLATILHQALMKECGQQPLTTIGFSSSLTYNMHNTI